MITTTSIAPGQPSPIGVLPVMFEAAHETLYTVQRASVIDRDAIMKYWKIRRSAI